jgi:hypothetical protein
VRGVLKRRRDIPNVPERILHATTSSRGALLEILNAAQSEGADLIVMGTHATAAISSAVPCNSPAKVANIQPPLTFWYFRRLSAGVAPDQRRNARLNPLVSE